MTDIGSDFESWNLHDAVPLRLAVEWGSKTCTFELEAFLIAGEDAVPCRIEWSGLRRLSLNRETPWGDAVQFNRHWLAGSVVYVIEMQTGSAIEIEAESVRISTDMP